MKEIEQATLVVKGDDGKEHIIHSDEFGIAAIVDCLKRLEKLEKRYEDLQEELFNLGCEMREDG